MSDSPVSGYRIGSTQRREQMKVNHAENLELSEVAHLSSPLTLGHRVIPDFRSRTHQKVISDAVMDAIWGRGPRFIAVSIPQQQGKSTLISVLLPALYIEWHALGLVPGGLVGLVSAEDSLVLDFSLQSRNLIRDNPDAFTARLRSDSKAASFWQTEQGGGIIATGVGGSIYGRPISLLIFDDVIKGAEQANSEKHRELVWRLWQGVGYGRLQPWTVVLVCMVRWHPDDFIGRLLTDEYPGDPSEWRYIRIPAVCEDEENDPCGRKVGDALLRPQAEQTQEEANAEMARVKSGISDFYWSTLWQQEPSDPEGTIFYERCWRYYGPDAACYNLPAPNEFDRVFMSWDMAFKATTDSDYVVGQAWGAKDADRYLLDQVRGRWSFTETVDQVRGLASRIRLKYPIAQAILVEDKANGPAVISQLQSKVGGLIEFKVNDYGSKESRAHACQPLLIAGNLYIPSSKTAPWVSGFVKELGEFPKGKNDDMCDCLSQSLLWLMDNSPAEVSVAPSPSSLPRSAIHRPSQTPARRPFGRPLRQR